MCTFTSTFICYIKGKPFVRVGNFYSCNLHKRQVLPFDLLELCKTARFYINSKLLLFNFHIQSVRVVQCEKFFVWLQKPSVELSEASSIPAYCWKN